MISMIAAIGKDRELGKNNELIWHIPEDMKFFKDTTIGHTVIMGKKTFLSLPGMLKDRKMIVLTNDKKQNNNECVFYCNNIQELISKYQNTEEEVFIIGGASVYQQFIDICDLIYLTEIDQGCMDADSFFPEFDKSKFKRRVIKKSNYNNIDFEICKYVRK